MTRTVAMRTKGMIGLSVLLAGLAGAAFAQDVIKARKDAMQAQRATLGALKKVVDDKGPAATASAEGKKLQTLAAQIPGLYPQGSNQGDTKALPAIWTDWNGFTAAARDLETAAQQIVVAADANNMDGVSAGFAAAGKACAGCHDRFRGR